MSKKQTAVEWLIEHINSDAFIRAYEMKEWIAVFKQAKEMEREQIKDSWDDAYEKGTRDRLEKTINPVGDADIYYNETYTQ